MLRNRIEAVPTLLPNALLLSPLHLFEFGIVSARPLGLHVANTLRGQKLIYRAVAVRVLIVDVLAKVALSAASRRMNDVQSEGSVRN